MNLSSLLRFVLILVTSFQMIGCGTASGGDGSNSGSGGTASGGGIGSPDFRGSSPAPSTGGQNNQSPGNGQDDGGNNGGNNAPGGGGGGGGDVTLEGATNVALELPAIGSVRTLNFEGVRNQQGDAIFVLNFSNEGVALGRFFSYSMLGFEPSAQELYTSQLRAFNGQVLSRSDDNPIRTLGVVPGGSFLSGINAFTYPTRGADTSLRLGAYIQTLKFIGGTPGATVRGRIAVKNDNTALSGLLKVNVFLVGGDAQNVASQIEDAITSFKTIYQQAGITVDHVVRNINFGGSAIPSPASGSDVYETASQSIPNRLDALNVFIGNTVENDDFAVLGLSGGIPGPYFPSRRSGVGVSLELHGGVNGFLTPANRVFMGETIAHEVGHYLGLFHPVEFIDIQEPLQGFRGQDALGSPTCSSIQECIALGVGANLMFPTPVGQGIQQTNLTANQMDVLNINPLVN